MGMSGSDYNGRANEITYEYFCVLNGQKSTRHMVYKNLRRNGNYTYFTYHLWQRWI